MEQGVQRLLEQIDMYIGESKDANFDRYLIQMKQILMAEPQRMEEIRQAVARNMNRYRENVRRREKTSVEFKVGAGVLSGIGILFMLAAVVILVRNFMPPFVQGMAMLAFFALVWVAAQTGLMRVAKKLALGLSGAAIVGLYLSVFVNLNIFEILPPYWAQGLMVLVAVASWLNGFFIKSAVLQCLSFGGYLLFSMGLPWEQSVPEFVLLLVTMAGLNLMWHFGAAGQKKDLVRLIHMLCFGAFSLFYGIFVLYEAPGNRFLLAMLYGMVMVGLMNLFYIRSKGPGGFATWMSYGVFQVICLLVAVDGLQMGGQYLMSQWMLVLIGFNLIILLATRFRWYGMGVYFQSFFLLLFVIEGATAWLGIASAVVLFVIGLVMEKEKKLAHELVMTVYGVLFLMIVVPNDWTIAAQVAFLLGITVLCLYVPRLRAPKPEALVYTNISLLGAWLLWMGMRRIAEISSHMAGMDYVVDTVLLVLYVLAVLVLWRDCCYLPQRIQGLILGLVLTYMILIYRIQIPVVASIVLMVVAVGAIVFGFIRKEMPLRIYGLCLALFVCAKVVLYDYWHLELFAKSILLLAVGLIAIGISVIYAVLEYSQRKPMRR